MGVKQTLNRAKSEIQQTRNAIRRSWSREERDKRRQITEARQEWLFGVLFTQRVAILASVA
jgi:hypothetical protein